MTDSGPVIDRDAAMAIVAFAQALGVTVVRLGDLLDAHRLRLEPSPGQPAPRYCSRVQVP
jgi:hypothetical protein